jgi:hypothetical protein
MRRVIGFMKRHKLGLLPIMFSENLLSQRLTGVSALGATTGCPCIPWSLNRMEIDIISLGGTKSGASVGWM